ncbi:MAG: SLC13 family permease [Rhodoferax sp.]
MAASGLTEAAVVAVFATVYIGLMLGGLPWLKLDRSGVALLGAIAMVGLGIMSLNEAAAAVDLPTLVLLFAFMVLSAQMRLGGFYTAVVHALAQLRMGPRALMAALIAVTAGLAAVFSNDIVCLALTPVVVQMCQRRGLNPVAYCLALACAANIGSAATLIGNPQNMLIGSMARLDFADYARRAALPVGLGLLALWGWLAWRAEALHGTTPGTAAAAPAQTPLAPGFGPLQQPAFDAWQSSKGALVATVLLIVFLATDVPREVAALVGAGVLLSSRRLHSARVLGLIDGGLLLLFVGLFVVNRALAATGLPLQAVQWLAQHGVALNHTSTLLGLSVVLSNLVSNVPAVMLLLPHVQGDAAAALLALASTFAGNLMLVGSIANLIVVDLAQRCGVRIGWREHLRVGLPVTLLSLIPLIFL